MGEGAGGVWDCTEGMVNGLNKFGKNGWRGEGGQGKAMKTTIEQALRWKLAIGAHPGYPDRANFGRLELKLPPKEIADSVFEQVRALAEVAERCGARLVHVKPHGALYNQAVNNRELAAAIAEGVKKAVADVAAALRR